MASIESEATKERTPAINKMRAGSLIKLKALKQQITIDVSIQA
ncbi:MAG: hypothetical protein ABIT58_02950 [Ferruginibacter sp.]